MKAFLESLSFSSGAVHIAVLSAGVVWLLCFTCASSLRKVWVVVVPLALTNCLYWSVAWLEAEGDEYHRALVMSDYHNWALLFIGAWFLAGAIPSAAIVGLLRRRAKGSFSVRH
jgi:hypothetical protein